METQTVTDKRGIPVTLPAHPQRIVSLICSITETIFDFGAGDRLCGRTSYCIRPPGKVDAVPSIGGPKAPDIDAILAQRPDLVIANIEENEKRDVDILESEGIPVFVTYPRTVADSIELLGTLGRLIGAEEAAKPFVEEAGITADAVRDAVKELHVRSRVLYLIWRKPYMTVNRDTYIHSLIEFCGGENVFAEHADRYPVIVEDDIFTARPDVIVLPSEPFRFLERHRGEIMQLTGVPAVESGNVALADGEMFSWYGTRMIHGLKYAFGLLTGRPYGPNR